VLDHILLADIAIGGLAVSALWAMPACTSGTRPLMMPTNQQVCSHIHHYVQLFYPRDQTCELIEWTKAPPEPLHGRFRGSDKIFGENKVIDFAFTVMRVKGSIKWKYIGDGDGESRSTLKLKRWDENLGEGVNILELCHFVGTPGESKTLQFDFEYSTNNALWGPGEKGAVFLILASIFYG